MSNEWVNEPHRKASAYAVDDIRGLTDEWSRFRAALESIRDKCGSASSKTIWEIADRAIRGANE